MIANIKITELTELLTADTSNTIIFATDLSVSPNVSHFLRIGTISSLTDYSIANGAFLRANVAFSTGYNANTALNTAELAFAKANIAHLQANVATVTGTSAFFQANTAFNYANTLTLTSSNFTQAAFNAANVAFSTGFNANLALITAQAAFIQANVAQPAFNRANNSVLKTGDVITGIVTVPTAAPLTSNNMIASTAYVRTAVLNAIDLIGTMSIQNSNNVSISGGTITNTTVNGHVVGLNAVGARTVSTSTPTGGNNGDIWYQY